MNPAVHMNPAERPQLQPRAHHRPHPQPAPAPGRREEAERAQQKRVVAALARQPAHFEPSSHTVTVMETHISYVLLTGGHAYKIKKAVRFGFLDFTTLERRKHFCDEELRLNRRLAPELYLDVVPICGTPDDPRIGGRGPVLEYAVQMKEFAQDALASSMLPRGALTREHIDALATRVADFHRDAACAGTFMPFGRSDAILALAMANFAEIRALGPDADDARRLRGLKTWTRAEHLRQRAKFGARLRSGAVRECHGDLHLRNIAFLGNDVTIFDCIEFNEQMRWIDVASEIAFTAMDLDHGGRHDLARRFVNRYLEETGDYEALAVLRFYLVYRAMVRAKVAHLRAVSDKAAGPDEAFVQEFRHYVKLAESYTTPRQPALVITHGFAGCGKTTLTDGLLENMDAVRIRSDVERKRLSGLRAREASHSGIDTELYAPDATKRTYDEMARLARLVIDSGAVALIDATFLHAQQRAEFRRLASALSVPFIIIDVRAADSTLRERLLRRQLEGTDASEAGVEVLEHQLRTHEPLSEQERRNVVEFDGGRSVGDAEYALARRHLVERIVSIGGNG